MSNFYKSVCSSVSMQLTTFYLFRNVLIISRIGWEYQFFQLKGPGPSRNYIHRLFLADSSDLLPQNNNPRNIPITQYASLSRKFWRYLCRWSSLLVMPKESDLLMETVISTSDVVFHIFWLVTDHYLISIHSFYNIEHIIHSLYVAFHLWLSSHLVTVLSNDIKR